MSVVTFRDTTERFLKGRTHWSDRHRYRFTNRMERDVWPLIGGMTVSEIEAIDVATPATFHRYTNNWQGSYEGWLPAPGAMLSRIGKTLPGLGDFYHIGQWVEPGGGLPNCIRSGFDRRLQSGFIADTTYLYPNPAHIAPPRAARPASSISRSNAAASSVCINAVPISASW